MKNPAWKNKYLPLTFFISVCGILSFQCFSQSVVEGILKDSDNDETIKFATVYISGTTKGTITNAKGEFNIIPDNFPCDLVISHIGYNRKVLVLQSEGNLGIIQLTQKIEAVNEVTINATDNRASNLEQFRESFLGKDRWGKAAKITNDSVLSFTREQKNNSSTLTTVSKEPLRVELPLLGYNLLADIVQARSDEESESRLGYYFYTPLDRLSKRRKKVVEKNRELVYYNSTMHFLRSLYEGNLAKQGYRVIKKVINESTGVINEEEVYFNKHIQLQGTEKIVFGLENENYIIWYIHKKSGEPVDLTLKQKQPFERAFSTISFLADTCIIRKDGTAPDLSILFGGTMAAKKVGADLPSDYNTNKDF